MKSSASHDSDVFERKIHRQMGAWNYVSIESAAWKSAKIATEHSKSMNFKNDQHLLMRSEARLALEIRCSWWFWSAISSSARWIISAIISNCQIFIQADSKKANNDNWISGAFGFPSNFSRCRVVSWSMIRMRAEENWKKFVDSLTERKYFTGTEHEHDSWLRHGGIVNWKTKGNYRKCHFSRHHHIAGCEFKSFCHWQTAQLMREMELLIKSISALPKKLSLGKQLTIISLTNVIGLRWNRLVAVKILADLRATKVKGSFACYLRDAARLQSSHSIVRSRRMLSNDSQMIWTGMSALLMSLSVKKTNTNSWDYCGPVEMAMVNAQLTTKPLIVVSERLSFMVNRELNHTTVSTAPQQSQPIN